MTVKELKKKNNMAIGTAAATAGGMSSGNQKPGGGSGWGGIGKEM